MNAPMHTSAPWTARKKVNGGFMIEKDGIETICSVPGYGCGPANAALIAAAPELLAALQGLLPEVDSEIDQRKYGGNCEDWAQLEALSNAAHAAIAKAVQ